MLTNVVPQDAHRILEMNLAAIARRNPETARRIREGVPSPDLRFIETPEGLSAEVLSPAGPQALASRRRPAEEARRFAEAIDLKAAAAFIVAGFGAGYHVRELAARLGKAGVVVVFEPDVALLRAVLERIDCSSWLGTLNVAILVDAGATGEMAATLRGVEGIVALGVQLIAHAPTKARLGGFVCAGRPAQQVFHDNFLSLVKATKLAIVTTLMQMRTTLRNLTQNIDVYLASEGLNDLKGACEGRPAVVVSAGPSLARNVDLLSRPGVRERVVIIAVQTVLKGLLARGIRPHFVTALDYSDISARFYEGLTPADVEGVTLVVEPKVNPAVTSAWAALGGRIRCSGDKYLDQLLTPAYAPRADSGGKRDEIESGATVAHLAYYLARYLGCDPVALVGQDLGFTDGQYYGAGAAIHDVWAMELSEFTTLEALEWQRIARMGHNLHRATDHLGRPMFTDEQMNSYLVQFERDFLRDSSGERGLSIYDCTEGGVRKQHAAAATLAEFLDEFAGEARPRLPDSLARARGSQQVPRLRDVREHVERAARDARRVAGLSREAAGVLLEMKDHLGPGSTKKLNALIERVHVMREEVEKLQPAYALTHQLNQIGSLNRIRADRLIQLDGSLDERAMQARQVERDAENVKALAKSADDLAVLLDQAAATLADSMRAGIARARKITRDSCAAAPAPNASAGDESEAPGRAGARVAAVILFDPRTASEIAMRPLARAKAPLVLTVERLLECESLAAIAVLTPDADLARRLLGDIRASPRVHVLEATRDELRISPAVRAARRLAPWAWRNAPATFTAADEVFAPEATLRALETLNCDAALLCGPDWALVDPGLCGEIMARHVSDPERFRLTFTQAPPGLCGHVLHRSLIEELLRLRRKHGCFASIGGMLGYVPSAPATDLIAYPPCVPVPPAVRDLARYGHRLIADSQQSASFIARLIARASGAGNASSALQIAETLRSAAFVPPPVSPQQLILQLVDARGRTLDPRRAIALIRGAAQAHPDVALHLTGARLDSLHTSAGTDALAHPDLEAIMTAAREHSIEAVHLRTNLLGTRERVEALASAAAAPHVISADILAETAATYARVTGLAPERFAHVRENFDALLAVRRSRRGTDATPAGEWMAPPLVVARITRCDAVYEEIETFYNRWWMLADGAVIDPLPAPRPGERIAPLPLPASARERIRNTTLAICADGSALIDTANPATSERLPNAAARGVSETWSMLHAGRVPESRSEESITMAVPRNDLTAAIIAGQTITA